MATYAIGDIQGCHRELLNLLELVAFSAGRDKLWLCGDLVNRGPQSRATLDTVMALDDDVITVLGNHDLHLLAVALTPGRQPKKRDTLDDILGAPRRLDYVDWLRHRPLFHVDERLGVAMVHAGLPPQWTIEDARERAAEVELVLREEPDARAFLAEMYGNGPARWDEALTGFDRLRYIVNCMTRLRLCTADGRLDLEEKGAPGKRSDGRRPWFEFGERRSRSMPLVFGHWSTLRVSAAECRRHRVYPLDTGAVWGDRLTALRLEDKRLFSVSSSVRVPHA